MSPKQTEVPVKPKHMKGSSVLVSALVASILILTLVISAFARPQQPQATIVRCDPKKKIAVMGEMFTVDIYVEDVQDLRSIDVRMSYDPDLVEPLDGDPNIEGVNLEPLNSFFLSDFSLRNGYNLIDGAGETVPVWYAALQQGSGSNGSGAIARLYFKPLKIGEMEMEMLQTKMAAFRGAPIAHSNQNCQVAIVDPTQRHFNFMPVIYTP